MAKRTSKEKTGRPLARAKTNFAVYPVREATELLEFLLKVKSGASRTAVKSLLTNRQVSVENKITTQYNYPLRPGMKVQISDKRPSRELQSSLLKIVYEDAYLLVIDKKEGVATINADKQRGRSAHSIVLDHLHRINKFQQLYVVQRLDKEASGLLVFAKDEKTKISLQDRWHELAQEHKFVAVLAGELEKDKGTIASWLAEGQVCVTHSDEVRRNNETAITYYQTIKRANGYSLVEFDLKSGKKDKIRVHAQELGHPVLGDQKFGQESTAINRLALHAFKLSFHHPVTGQFMKFETPYPSVFKKLMLKETAG